jgi:hypothetical protein
MILDFRFTILDFCLRMHQAQAKSKIVNLKSKIKSRKSKVVNLKSKISSRFCLRKQKSKI